jgi:very-short-patch-repair endonuclease
MTDAEKKLWFRINRKQLNIKFRRQQPIGKYIGDFVCFEKKLIFEIDGSQYLNKHSDLKKGTIGSNHKDIELFVSGITMF